MNDSIFRKTSMDRLKSPEQLNEYIRVARPSVWLVLAAIILLLVGALVWGIFGKAETIVRAGAYTQNGRTVCLIAEEDAAEVAVGQQVIIGKKSGTVKSVSQDPVQAHEEDHYPYMIQAAGMEAGGSYREAELDISVKDGIGYADITVESVHPITFVIQ